MRLQVEPGTYWAACSEGPLVAAHQNRRQLALGTANMPAVPDIPLSESPDPPYTALDAALVSALNLGDFAYASQVFASVTWSWRDISSSRRRLAEASIEHPNPTSLSAMFEFLDALPMLDTELTPQRPNSLLYNTLADVLTELTAAASFPNGSSAWWLVRYCQQAHRRALIAAASPPPLLHWLHQIPSAQALLTTDSARSTARALSDHLHVDPCTLAQLACQIDPAGTQRAPNRQATRVAPAGKALAA